MPVTMICPNLKCGQTVVAPDSSRGKIVRCAHCRLPFMVPRGAPAEKNKATKPAEAPKKS